MPPVLEALQAVFPDLLPQELGAPAISAEDPNDSAQQPAAADASSYESRIRAISSQVSILNPLAIQLMVLAVAGPISGCVLQFTKDEIKHSDQQQYLEAQKQHATAAADEEAKQADIGKTGRHSSCQHLRITSNFAYITCACCSLHTRLEEGWPTCQGISPGPQS